VNLARVHVCVVVVAGGGGGGHLQRGRRQGYGPRQGLRLAARGSLGGPGSVQRFRQDALSAMQGPPKPVVTCSCRFVSQMKTLPAVLHVASTATTGL